MNKFKLNDMVKCISSRAVDKQYKNKLGKIIRINNHYNYPYTVAFFEPIFKGNEPNDCWWNFYEDEIELYRKPILKLFLKEKENKI